MLTMGLAFFFESYYLFIQHLLTDCSVRLGTSPTKSDRNLKFFSTHLSLSVYIDLSTRPSLDFPFSTCLSRPYLVRRDSYHTMRYLESIPSFCDHKCSFSLLFLNSSLGDGQLILRRGGGGGWQILSGQIIYFQHELCRKIYF